MAEHSILPPSSAARRVACPGSRALEAQYPQEESAHSREGTAAHWVASEMLKKAGDIAYLTPGNFTPDNELITQEMWDGAVLYSKEITRYPIGFLDRYQIEKQIEIPGIHPNCWGTPDCWLTQGSTLHIFDYKFGYGFIEVFENWQLIEYASGISTYLAGMFPLIPLITNTVFHIIQPRSFHREGQIRKWEISFTNLIPYFHKLKEAEHLSMTENAPLSPSGQCGYCTARHVCSALQASSLRIADITYMQGSNALTPEQTGVELKQLKHAAELLDARITGLEEEAISYLKNGKSVPYYRLEQGYGRERWTRPVEEIITMGELLNCDLKKPMEIITPKQAVKLGMPEEVVKMNSEVPRGSLKLTEDNPKKIFKKYA